MAKVKNEAISCSWQGSQMTGMSNNFTHEELRLLIRRTEEHIKMGYNRVIMNYYKLIQR